MKRTHIIGWTLGIVMALPFVYRAVDWWNARGEPVDAAMAEAGKTLFEHEWTPGDPLANGGDGLGPVFNASSCVACHRQGGAGGSGPFEANVNIFTIRPESNLLAQGAKARQGVVHAQATSADFQETFGHVHPFLASLPMLNQVPVGAGGVRGTAFPQGINLSQRKTPALFGARLIDEIPDRDIIANERIERLKSGLDSPKERGKTPLGRVARMADGRIGRFGWKAQTVSLTEFVRAACANELGLGNPGQTQPQPLSNPSYVCTGYDLTLTQCDQLTEFINSLPRPVERPPQGPEAGRRVRAGKSLFGSVGCADCHTPDVGSVRGLYSDLLLHEMGEDLEAGGNYNDRPLDDPAFKPGTGPLPAEWRTPPLWGIARSAPYLHDGRARTLEEAIRLHGGQGSASAERFNKLSADERDALISFLKTLDTP